MVEGLDAAVVVLGGPDQFPEVVPTEVYRRLDADLRHNGTFVVAGLSGQALDAPLEAGSRCSRSTSSSAQRPD